MHILMVNGMFKKKIDIDRHGPRLMLNNYQHILTHLISRYQLPLKVLSSEMDPAESRLIW